MIKRLRFWIHKLRSLEIRFDCRSMCPDCGGCTFHAPPCASDEKRFRDWLDTSGGVV